MASLDPGEESKKRRKRKHTSLDPGEEGAFLEDPTVSYDSGEEREDQEMETDLPKEEQETQPDLMEEEETKTDSSEEEAETDLPKQEQETQSDLMEEEETKTDSSEEAAETDSSEEAEKKREWEREHGWLKDSSQRIEFKDEWVHRCVPEEAQKFKKDFTDSEGFDVDDGCPAVRTKFYRIHPLYEYNSSEARKQLTITTHCAIKAVGRHNRRTRDKLEFDELVKVNMMISENEDEGLLYFITLTAYPEGQKEMAKEYRTRVRYVGSPKKFRADVHCFMPKPLKPGAEVGKPEPAAEAGKTEQEKLLEERESGWSVEDFRHIIPKIERKDENYPEAWERVLKFWKDLVDSEGFGVYDGCPFRGFGFYRMYPLYEYNPKFIQNEKDTWKNCAMEAVSVHNRRTHDNLEFDLLVRVNMLIYEFMYYFITLRAHRMGEKEETESKKYRTRVIYHLGDFIVQSFMPEPQNLVLRKDGV